MALLTYCIILLQGYANLALRNDTWFSYLSLSALVRKGQENETELMEHPGCMPTTAKLQFVKKQPPQALQYMPILGQMDPEVSGNVVLKCNSKTSLNENYSR